MLPQQPIAVNNEHPVCHGIHTTIYFDNARCCHDYSQGRGIVKHANDIHSLWLHLVPHQRNQLHNTVIASAVERNALSAHLPHRLFLCLHNRNQLHRSWHFKYNDPRLHVQDNRHGLWPTGLDRVAVLDAK